MIRDVIIATQPIKGCNPFDMEVEEELFAMGGITPYPVAAPPKAGVPVGKITGGLPELTGVAPDEDGVVGLVVGFVVVGDTELGNAEEDDHV